MIPTYFTGGYNYPNTAKLWTSLTALALGEEISSEIPEHKVKENSSLYLFLLVSVLYMSCRKFYIFMNNPVS